MDKATRNAIERATQQARKLLDEDFSSQLEGTFDVSRSGIIASKGGGHLSELQQSQRDKIVAAIEHKRSSGMTAADAVADYVRDAAFTTVNRFVALKMLEARELAQECITRGEHSAGYREFCGMAPGVSLLPEAAGYRLYIESLFDEFSTEIKVLFDRRDPASVLWPKRSTFDQLLQIMNSSELASVWAEDETIGWVYQFFNGQEERRQMREESQAPRNSRELAVRNQFFTPRYVVQFLTDNTLGRMWYEMRSTKTELAERCEYMVRKPGEEFASRTKKDPRDLHVLDPACGSGHFLLYAFDLLLVIYEEAHSDPDSPKSDATGRRLVEDYPSLDELRNAIPGLIIARNLHGVDIDPRCAQIGQLALWMRAQKAYREFGIGRVERSPIRRSNIVVAEPLVADEQITDEFVTRLGDAELERVFSALVGSLNLAGELGLLLRVERLVGDQAKRGQTGDLFAPPEERIRATLARFVSDESGRVNTRRRIFADDAAHGVALLSLAEKKFDIVLMNPPFGDSTEPTRAWVRREYPSAASDLALAMLQRAFELSAPEALTGILMPRPCYFLNSYETWRRALGDEFHRGVRTMADLGAGVLDAVVEVAATVFGQQDNRESTFLRVLSTANKDQHLSDILAEQHHRDRFSHTFGRFGKLPGAITAYSATPRILDMLESSVSLEQRGARAYQGLSTSDNERFVRLWSEVPRYALGTRWRPLAKGGAYSRYYSSIDLVVDWCADGRLLEAAPGTVLRNRTTYFGMEGITYTLKTKGRFSPRYMAAGCAYSPNGNAVFFDETKADLMSTLGVMASRMFEALLMLSTATGDTASAGGPGRSYTNGIVNRIPAPTLRLTVDTIESVRLCVGLRRSLNSFDEVSVDFDVRALKAVILDQVDLDRALYEWWQRSLDQEHEFLLLDGQVDRAVLQAYGLGDAEASWLDECVGPHPTEADCRVEERIACGVEALRRPGAYLVEQSRAFSVRRPDFVSELNLEGEPSFAEVCQYLRVHPTDLRAALNHVPPPESFSRTVSTRLLSVAMGIVFGRWPFADRSSGIDIAVEDAGHPLDLVSLIEQLAPGSNTLRVAVSKLGITSLREWVRHWSFASHLEDYTRSRRAAPIYWRLAPASGEYGIWLYVHASNKDTLFRVQNDYVVPKLAYEQRRLDLLSADSGGKPTIAQRKELEAQQTFVEELRTFLEEVKRVAPLWNPNLEDGVVINFAPLWRLVPQNKSWQKDLKGTWDEICNEKYDWSHLAMHLWPERVVPKCAKDRSLAITHGLEEILWAERDDGKWVPRPTPTRPIDELVRERTSVTVKAALKSLLEAPVAKGNGGRGRGRKAANAAAEIGAR